MDNIVSIELPPGTLARLCQDGITAVVATVPRVGDLMHITMESGGAGKKFRVSEVEHQIRVKADKVSGCVGHIVVRLAAC